MEPRFQGEGVVSVEYFFGFYKTRHILLSDCANCTVLRAVVLTKYRRVTDRQTDGQTDGIAVANTALAMRALRALYKVDVFWHTVYIARYRRHTGSKYGGQESGSTHLQWRFIYVRCK